MRSAGAVLPPSASVSGGIAGGSSIRRGRNKRREKARKSSGGIRGGVGGDGGGTGGSSSLEEREYQVALHMDILEGVVDKFDEDVDDDEYDEFAELDDNDDDDAYEGKTKKKRKGTGGTSKKKAVSSSSSSVPKYLKARSLASILIEEASRSDSMAKQYVDANVRRLGSGMTSTRQKVDAGGGGSSNSVITTITNPYPHRKFCPVTGLVGEYTEPRTGIPYATLSALEQIRERPPPWMSINNSGSANYWEAVKSLQNH